MSGAYFKPVQISPRVWWVGVVDWMLSNFHGYATHRGTTYNAYLITGDPIILIDTVKKPFLQEMLQRINEIVPPEKIDVIVSNHSEMDHSGSLPEMMEITKAETLIASPRGTIALEKHFHRPWNIKTVNDGETFTAGNSRLTFFEARMLHWPDSMFTYFHEDGVLFSNDVFGMHFASSHTFEDEEPPEVVEWETEKYFANLMAPYKQVMLKMLNRLEEFMKHNNVKIIATDHGPIWRKEERIKTVLSWYRKWSECRCDRKVLITYDTMYGSTEKMALAIADGVKSESVTVKVYPLFRSHRSDVATELLTAAAFVVGSPTINSNMFPSVADALTYIRGLKPAGKIGAAFGSYGWNAQGFLHLKKELENMGIELIDEGIKVNYVPTREDLKNCFELGVKIAREVKSRF